MNIETILVGLFRQWALLQTNDDNPPTSDDSNQPYYTARYFISWTGTFISFIPLVLCVLALLLTFCRCDSYFNSHWPSRIAITFSCMILSVCISSFPIEDTHMLCIYSFWYSLFVCRSCNFLFKHWTIHHLLH